MIRALALLFALTALACQSSASTYDGTTADADASTLPGADASVAP